MYHAVLGMQVVIEDYMSCRTYRLVLILAIQIFAIITAASFALATFYVMVL
jgi:succinate dehydrogenase / fumarate reductase membrane anchor subunit